MNTSLQRLGKYRLQERVGGSGIAEVWKAFSPQLRRYVAIKILHADLKNDPRFITRFEREAQAIASLHHPNIVQIHDFQVLTDSNIIAYLVMDYIDGSTLADYIANTSRKKNFPCANEIVHLFAAICAAIDYAHSKGIVHGDIKPANILLDTHAHHHGDLERPPNTTAEDEFRRVKGGDLSLLHGAHNSIDLAYPQDRMPIVTDFGMTRLLGTPAGTLSRWGLVTPFYLSPKQAMGYVGDVSGDIYSLGVILYEICTGVPPFQGDSPSLIMMQHITATPTPPIEVNPDISHALSSIILRSLDKNPKMRFSSASEMAATLAEVLGVPIPDILNTPILSEGLESYAGNRQTTSIAPDGDLHRWPISLPPNRTAVTTARPHWTDGLMPVDVTTSNSMPDGEEQNNNRDRFIAPISPSADVSANEEGSQSAVTLLSLAATWQRTSTSPHWSPYQTASSPNWPPPPTPSPTPAFPLAPTPSLLRLALDRLGINPSLQRRYASKTSPRLPAATRSGAMQGERGGHRGVLRDSHLVLLAVLILLLIVSSLGALLVLAHQNSPLTAQQVGYAYFLSSRQLYVNNNQGIDDEVQIDLHGIAAPHPGKSYYAWLLGDENASEVPWLLLGKVSENQSNMHFLYTGDAAHTNLLTDMSRFVITENGANTTPNNPLLDQSPWRYYGEIFQTPSPKDVNHFSMLDYIRHLLVQAPELQTFGLQGGLSTWLMRNVEAIAQWTLNANEAWETKNIMLMSQQLINILYYIDGECVSADFQGMPPDMPTTPENGTIAHIAHFSLINPCIQQQQAQANQLKQEFSHTPPDYVDHMLFHLAGVIQSPGATPAVRTLAVQLNTAVNYVKGWLVQVRKDALQLCYMPNSQLTQLSALSILSDMDIHARDAYAGQTDLSTGQVQEGVTWIYDNMQRLASIDVTSHPTQ